MPHLTLTLQIRSKKKTLPATAVQRSVSNYEGLFLPLHHKIPLEVLKHWWLMPLAKEQNLVQLLIGQLYNHPWKLYVMQEQSQDLSTHFVSAYCTTIAACSISFKFGCLLFAWTVGPNKQILITLHTSYCNLAVSPS